MINRIHRFHGRGSLRFVYQHGKIVRGTFGSLRYVYNPRRKQYRAAVVVSRKVSKSAVVRNRIRRRVYEALREREKDITGPYDMIFTAFSDQIKDLPAPELRERLYLRMEEAGILPSKTPIKPATHDIVKTEES